mmetsp:Transcript_23352/g.67037  ORF Transcript_23352/g.67037 Transcript_23352/m.67037 type:complete len:327 (-) Transcript_23352:324-1304(-)
MRCDMLSSTSVVLFAVSTHAEEQRDGPPGTSRAGLICYDGTAAAGRALHQQLRPVLVLPIVQQHARRQLPIAAGTPGFLVVGVETLGDAGVYDEAHVRLANAQAERRGGHEDVTRAVHPLLLLVGALLWGHLGVVVGGLDALGFQVIRQLLALGTAQTVDDSALSVEVLADDGGHGILPRDLLRQHHILEVVPNAGGVELDGHVLTARCGRRGHRADGRVHHELMHDLVLHVGGGGGRQRHQRYRREQIVAQLLEFGVIRAEVAAPLDNTMRLINDESPQLALLVQASECPLDSRGPAELLGREKQQAEILQLVQDFELVVKRLCA